VVVYSGMNLQLFGLTAGRQDDERCAGRARNVKIPGLADQSPALLDMLEARRGRGDVAAKGSGLPAGYGGGA